MNEGLFVLLILINLLMLGIGMSHYMQNSPKKSVPPTVTTPTQPANIIHFSRHVRRVCDGHLATNPGRKGSLVVIVDKDKCIYCKKLVDSSKNK